MVAWAIYEWPKRKKGIQLPAGTISIGIAKKGAPPVGSSVVVAEIPIQVNPKSHGPTIPAPAEENR